MLVGYNALWVFVRHRLLLCSAASRAYLPHAARIAWHTPRRAACRSSARNKGRSREAGLVTRNRRGLSRWTC
jgi:hypothetical protein